MAFDNSQRSKLQALVNSCRKLLSEEFQSQLQTNYGIQPEGDMVDVSQLETIGDDEKHKAIQLRERIHHLVSGITNEKNPLKTAITRVIREQAFTVLNRFIALRMAEERGIIKKSCDKGFQSESFRVYEQLVGNALGNQYERYKTFLDCLYDELALDLGVLFDRFSPFALLFPRQIALVKLFELINHPDLTGIYREDETIGWVYQYFNDEVERKKMREESASPRNSRELAVRNQFFTPRYVVEFLTDNTLGKIWYEMTGGKTEIVQELDYFIKRPKEIFLKKGEIPPISNSESKTKEEMLLEPYYIEYRELKDPREIAFLDPACGSMHFGLYAFDLFERIYIDAYENYPELLGDLRKTYPDLKTFQKVIPELILKYNLHGIDIDPRAVQMAGLSLWLRAQKSYQKLNTKPSERPQIRKVNVVCAEPMPGEQEFLEEFIKDLKPGTLGEMLKDLFAYMRLAGEVGSLLKVEDEIQSIVKKYKLEYAKYLKEKDDQAGFLSGMAPEKPPQLFDFRDITDENFWLTAEEDILKALEAYANQALEHGYQRRLFADDTANGFAFIEVLRKKYDVVVMNPPFGALSLQGKDVLAKQYPISKNDLLAIFVERGMKLLHPKGNLGSITSRTCFFLTTFQKWREEVILGMGKMEVMADLGHGVMDNAMVEAAAYVLQKKARID